MPCLKKEVLTIFWANALLKKMCLYGISGGNYVAKTQNVLYCILGENLPLVESDLIYFRWKLPCLFSLYLAKISLLEKKISILDVRLKLLCFLDRKLKEMYTNCLASQNLLMCTNFHLELCFKLIL